MTMKNEPIISSSELVKIRRHLHAHPEVSNDEIETAHFVKKKLETLGSVQVIHPIGETGVAAIFDSHNKGKTILIRGDMDALPIQEVSDLAYCSTKKNIAHLCGHDGHTTILLGLASRLKVSMPKSGRVILLFQPGEKMVQVRRPYSKICSFGISR